MTYFLELGEVVRIENGIVLEDHDIHSKAKVGYIISTNLLDTSIVITYKLNEGGWSNQ